MKQELDFWQIPTSVLKDEDKLGFCPFFPLFSSPFISFSPSFPPFTLSSSHTSPRPFLLFSSFRLNPSHWSFFSPHLFSFSFSLLIGDALTKQSMQILRRKLEPTLGVICAYITAIASRAAEQGTPPPPFFFKGKLNPLSLSLEIYWILTFIFRITICDNWIQAGPPPRFLFLFK